MISSRLNIALSKVEIAAADLRFEQGEMQSALRSSAAAAEALGTEMRLTMYQARCVENDEGIYLPELLESHEAAEMAAVDLAMALGRSSGSG